MTVGKRIRNLLLSVLQLICVLLLFLDPEGGKNIVIGILQILLFFLGIRHLVFYFTMARYMVDGRAILYKGGIYLDLGIFLGFTHVFPSAWAMLYLVGYFLLNCAYRALKALDTRKIRDRRWIRMAAAACWYLFLVIIGLTHLQSSSVMVYLFCVEMTLSAVNRLAVSMRKTAIVYIP